MYQLGLLLIATVCCIVCIVICFSGLYELNHDKIKDYFEIAKTRLSNLWNDVRIINISEDKQ